MSQLPPKIKPKAPPPPPIKPRRWQQGDVAFMRLTVACWEGEHVIVQMERGTYIQARPDEILTPAEAHEGSRS